MLHAQPLQGPVPVDWEALAQIGPKDLPEPSEMYPGPWYTEGRGNGHMDVFDARNRLFAHVYLWDEKEWTEFEAALIKARNWRLDYVRTTT
jgi:hypothetical protein